MHILIHPKEIWRKLYKENGMQLSPLISPGFSMSSLLMQVTLLPQVHMYTGHTIVSY